jgi:hypothetical protein
MGLPRLLCYESPNGGDKENPSWAQPGRDDHPPAEASPVPSINYETRRLLRTVQLPPKDYMKHLPRGWPRMIIST